VLLMVVGLQFFSLGLISELITSQHEERAARGADRAPRRRRASRPPGHARPLFGTYERDYPRNAQVISCLRRAGVEVEERHVAVWGGSSRQLAAGAGAARARSGRARAAAPAPGDFDAVLVGYPGHFDPACRQARRAAAGGLQPARPLADVRLRPRPLPRRLLWRRGHCRGRPARCGRPISSWRTRAQAPTTWPSSPGSRASASRSPTSEPRSGSSDPAGRPPSRSRCYSSAS
jgi:hypothetical protein